MEFEKIKHLQETICKKYNAAFREPNINGIVGVSKNFTTNGQINGLRHSSTDTTEGWYIWSGEWSDSSNFFKPVHLLHVIEKYPEITPYLGLPPGWRFLIDPENGYEDVWRDNSLIIDVDRGIH